MGKVLFYYGVSKKYAERQATEVPKQCKSTTYKGLCSEHMKVGHTDVDVGQVLQVQGGTNDVPQALLEYHMAARVARVYGAHNVWAVVRDAVIVTLHVAHLGSRWGGRRWSLWLVGTDHDVRSG